MYSRSKEDLRDKKKMIQIQNYILKIIYKIIFNLPKNFNSSPEKIFHLYFKKTLKLQLFIEFVQQNIMKNTFKTISKFYNFFFRYIILQKARNYLILTSTISFSLGIMLNCNFNKIQNFKAH